MGERWVRFISFQGEILYRANSITPFIGGGSDGGGGGGGSMRGKLYATTPGAKRKSLTV